MFGASSGKSFVIGAKQVKNAIKAEKASKVYSAASASNAKQSKVGGNC